MQNRKTIIVSGFKFSGSSAISEYLLDYDDCCCFSSPFAEPRFVGVAADNLLSRLLDEFESGRTATWSASDFQAFSAKLRDAFLSKEPQIWLQKMNAGVRQRLGPDSDRRIAQTLDIISEMNADTTRDAFLSECRNMFGDLFELIPKIRPDMTVIVNNDPPAYGGDCGHASSLYLDAKVIAVLRDPKDMYFELSRGGSAQFPRTEVGVQRWIAAMKRHIAHFYRLKGRNDVCLVSFEGFVSEDAIRRKVAQFAGLSRYKDEGRLFDSEVSRKNIGHQTLEPKLAGLIDKELGEIIHQAYIDFNSPNIDPHGGRIWMKALQLFGRPFGMKHS